MIRITRMTDYGIVLVTHMARDLGRPTRTARELSADAHLPLATVSKILKTLARGGLLVAHRGVKGGFSLARRPREINVADIITALEGPIAITECSALPAGRCEIEQLCPVSSNWKKINTAVSDALKGITLADMAQPLRLVQRRGRFEFQSAV